MMPTQQEIEVPLLRALKQLGGEAAPKAVYKAVTRAFPTLTGAELAEQLPSGGNKWTNRIQWVRQRLVSKGELESQRFGVWAITSKGLARVSGDGVSDTSHRDGKAAGAAAPTSQPAPVPQNFEETVDDYLDAFKKRLLQKLHDLSPAQFEEFAGVLLRGYGFQKVEVTGKTGDGGIDGHGELRVGLAILKAGFQCKRWQGPVDAKEVRAFRGAIQGHFEQGYFFTTSTFSKAAQAASVQSGAVPVILFDGNQIAAIMIDRSIGVTRRPVEIYDDKMDELFGGP